jgi:cytochrome oxidase Cu insertion factor (SCO1/SenC/PrrC family)
LSTSATPSAVARGRRTLLLIAALFLAPLAAAFWLYYGGAHWRPAGSTHRGDLIDPARPLPSVELATPEGGTTGAHFLRETWTIVYVGDGLCDARCRKALYLTRQSRIALNKDFDRVQRAFLVTANCCDREFLAREHADLSVALLEGDAARRLLDVFPVYDSVPVAEAGRIYVVDPLGNLMMSYAASAPDKALLQDLRKLLQLSHIG